LNIEIIFPIKALYLLLYYYKYPRYYNLIRENFKGILPIENF